MKVWTYISKDRQYKNRKRARESYRVRFLTGLRVYRIAANKEFNVENPRMMKKFTNETIDFSSRIVYNICDEVMKWHASIILNQSAHELKN